MHYSRSTVYSVQSVDFVVCGDESYMRFTRVWPDLFVLQRLPQLQLYSVLYGTK